MQTDIPQRRNRPVDKPANGARVVATRFGFYNGNRRKPGATFRLVDDKDFSPRWMQRVAAPEVTFEEPPADDAPREAKRGRKRLKGDAEDEPVSARRATVEEPPKKVTASSVDVLTG